MGNKFAELPYTCKFTRKKNEVLKVVILFLKFVFDCTSRAANTNLSEGRSILTQSIKSISCKEKDVRLMVILSLVSSHGILSVAN